MAGSHGDLNENDVLSFDFSSIYVVLRQQVDADFLRVGENFPEFIKQPLGVQQVYGMQRAVRLFFYAQQNVVT